MVKYVLIFLMLFLTGCCSSQFYSSTIGSSNIIGVFFPDDIQVKFELLNTLDGSRVLVKDYALIKHTTSITNTTTWFNLIESSSTQTHSIFIAPTNVVQTIVLSTHCEDVYSNNIKPSSTTKSEK